MTTRVARTLWVAGAAALLLLASCGSDASPATTDATQTTAPTPSNPPVSTGETTQPTEAAEVVVERCEDTATGIDVGSSIDGMLEMDGSFLEKQFFCVDVADGATTITIALTGMTADLNLYVGYPDMETLRGGGLTFWRSDDKGVGDEVVVLEPPLIRDAGGNFVRADHVTPGPYYIEVSSNGGSDPSPFILSVGVP